MFDTEVIQNYTPSLNLSITTRNGRVDRVTTWKTGVADSTKVRVNIPRRLRK
jgi:hypothetical protein